MIFETERLLIRKLNLSDVNVFHEMQSKPKVMRFVDGDVKIFDEHLVEITTLINKYDEVDNEFWIYAIERKQDHQFVGTVAMVKDEIDDEIGYRFLEKYWKLGYGSEICSGIISYSLKIGLKNIVAYINDENIASAKILEKNNFIIVDQFLNDDNQQETKYELKL